MYKTKGQALTNPGFPASTLSSNSTFSLSLCLSVSHTHTHTHTHTYTHTHTQQLFCLQQRLPVPVWPQQHTTQVTSWRRNGKQGHSRRKERGGRAKCGPLSAGFPLSFSPRSSKTHTHDARAHTHKSHKRRECERDSASDGWPNERGRCEFGSGSKRVASSEDLVKQISVFSPRLSLAHLLCRGLKRRSREGERGR